MSIFLKTQDWESSYSKYRHAISSMKDEDLEMLLDMYGLLSNMYEQYRLEKQALTDELEFRRTALGKELT